jgi:hypothetical protein
MRRQRRRTIFTKSRLSISAETVKELLLRQFHEAEVEEEEGEKLSKTEPTNRSKRSRRQRIQLEEYVVRLRAFSTRKLRRAQQTQLAEESTVLDSTFWKLDRTKSKTN